MSGKNYYGYKNHIAVDANRRFMRRFQVTAAHVHDSQCFEPLLDRESIARTVYADSAYHSQDQ